MTPSRQSPASTSAIAREDAAREEARVAEIESRAEAQNAAAAEADVLRCVKQNGEGAWVPQDLNSTLTAALKNRVCVKRAAEY